MNMTKKEFDNIANNLIYFVRKVGVDTETFVNAFCRWSKLGITIDKIEKEV